MSLDDHHKEKYNALKKRIRDIERKKCSKIKLERTFLLDRIEKINNQYSIDDSDDDVPSDQEHHTTLPVATNNNNKTVKPKKKKDPNAPKGPGNVFFLFCRLQRDKIKDEHPEERSLGEVTKLLSAKWKSLSSEEKKVYQDMYQKELEEYEVAMKSYTNSNNAPVLDEETVTSSTAPSPQS
ncbi:unnamed protein product [Cunninghamella echinulata]